MIDGRTIVRDYERYISRDAQFRQAWDKLAPYIQPTRSFILNDGTGSTPGRQQNLEQFDPTAMTACETMAAFVWGNVMNPATKWFAQEPERSANFDLNLRVGTRLGELDEVKEYCDEVATIMLGHYEQSNFYYEAFEALIDWGGFGTCDLHIEEKQADANARPDTSDPFRGFVFTNNPIGTFAIGEDPNGMPTERFCRYSRSAGAIVDEFKLANVSGAIAQAYENEREKLFNLIHCIKPRSYTEQKSKAAKHMPFASVYVEKDTHHVLRESGYEEFPDAIARYAKTAGELYGRGRGFMALPAIMSVDKLMFDEFEALEMAVKPALLSAIEDGGLGSIQLFPGGFTPVKLPPNMTDVRNAIAPIETGTKWQIVNLKIEEIRDQIERIFNVKHIRQLLEAEKMQTAFEYAQKLVLLNKMLGPVSGRMQAEFLNRTNERSFAILSRRRALPEPPAVLFQHGAKMNWRYNGPLTKAQRSDEAQSINLWIQEITALSQLDPDVPQLVDAKEAARVLGDVHSVPAKVIRSEDQVQKILVALKQKREQEAAAQEMLRATEGVKNLAPLAQKVLPEGGLGMVQ